ncbi:tripartite motif-containing protein 14 isoform X1 [Trichosurus vulpecula]|uniref:tripartite motif-containing protein 14 isoform X1 n=1 Tax=Trichosurus vulpecula TaxID=9337 RepID=UPI00186AC564|nr:tripartite motif-containing protein 14 isoform X1 [Trichosurus vulpecula]
MAMAAPRAAAAADPGPWGILEAGAAPNSAHAAAQRKPGSWCGRPGGAGPGAAAAAAAEEAQGRAEPEPTPTWLCSEHSNRTVELFCSRCRRCVCALCPLLGSHRGHPVRFVHEEVGIKQKDIQKCLKQLALKKKQEAGNISKVSKAASDLKEHSEATKIWLTGKFSELRLLLDEEEMVAKKFLDKNTEQAFRTYHEQVELGQERINIIDNLSRKIQRIHQQQDPVRLLQEYTASEKEMRQQLIPTELCHPVPVKFEHAKTYYRNLATAVFTTLQLPLEVRLKEDICSQLSVSSKSKPGTLLKTTPTPERSLFLKYARIPTLEPDTMHPRLRLSEDRLTVTCVLIGKIQLCNPQRFDKLWQVLSRDSFFSGSHYWEVDLLKSGIGWWIGVAYSSIERKGDSEASRLGFNRESWCLKRFDLEYWAFHNGERTRIAIDHDPERIGIFLDYEAGILSFYDITCGMTHLHTFYSRFQEPLYPALRLWEGSMTIRKLP